MDSPAVTEELDAIREPHVRATPLGSGREQCAGCGAALAADQRYCVECGQRLGRARLPFMDDPARHAAQPLAAQPPKRRLSVNSTLIAGVGTLLLAMGIGILIGRSSPSSSTRSAPVQIVGAPTSGAATSAGMSETPTSSTGGASTPSSGSSSSKAKAAAKAAKAKLPPPKVVTVGSPGKGKGYEKGHFTGNFFGKGEG